MGFNNGQFFHDQSGQSVFNVNALDDDDVPSLRSVSGGHMVVQYTDLDGQVYVLDPSRQRHFSVSDAYQLEQYERDYQYNEMLRATMTDTRLIGGLSFNDLRLFTTEAGGLFDYVNMPNGLSNPVDVQPEAVVSNIDNFSEGFGDYVQDRLGFSQVQSSLDMIPIPGIPSLPNPVEMIMDQIDTQTSGSTQQAFSRSQQGRRLGGPGQNVMAAGVQGRSQSLQELSLFRQEFIEFNRFMSDEKQLIKELYTLGNEDNFLNIGGDRHVADWPRIQQLMHEIGEIHMRMRQVYTIVKLKLDWLNKVSTALGGAKRSVSDAADSVFKQYFEFSDNTVSLLKQVYNQVQDNILQNASVRSERWKKDVNVIMTSVFEGVTTAINTLSTIPAFYSLKVGAIWFDVLKDLIEGGVYYNVDPYSAKHIEHYRDMDEKSKKTDWQGLSGSGEAFYRDNYETPQFSGNTDSERILTLIEESSLRLGRPVSFTNLDELEGRDSTPFIHDYLVSRGLVLNEASQTFQTQRELPESLFLPFNPFQAFDSHPDDASALSHWQVLFDSADIVGSASVRLEIDALMRQRGSLLADFSAEKQVRITDYLDTISNPSQITLNGLLGLFSVTEQTDDLRTRLADFLAAYKRVLYGVPSQVSGDVLSQEQQATYFR